MKGGVGETQWLILGAGSHGRYRVRGGGAGHCRKPFPVRSYVDLRSADASRVAREGSVEKLGWMEGSAKE